MEKINILKAMPPNYISDEIERILGEKNEKIEKLIIGFFEGELGNRVKQSKSIVREESFEIEIPATEVNPSAAENEKMLLQGVIDLYIEENDGIVLVDYKTDSCSDIYELEEKYAIQLKWYRYAMEKILRKKIKSVYIYSFHKNDYIDITERTEI